MSDKAWAEYKYGVLAALDRWAELPSELFLPTFSLPVAPQAKRRTLADGGGSDIAVTPSLSTVLAFSLDSDGTLAGARVAASSLSDGADTSVLAMVEQAAAARAFPHLPTGVSATELYLVVQSAEPTVDTLAAVLGALEAPAWRLSRPARLLGGSLPGGLVADSTAADRVPVMMAVDATGHVVGGTARLGTSASMPVRASPKSQARVLKELPALYPNWTRHFGKGRLAFQRRVVGMETHRRGVRWAAAVYDRIQAGTVGRVAKGDLTLSELARELRDLA